MCGRYTFVDVKDLPERFGTTGELPQLAPAYNVAPGSLMPVVIRQSPPRAVLMKWGLIPAWAKDIRIGVRMINARIETVAQKPAYKNSLNRRRCLVPANGFYEWSRDGTKLPYYFCLKDRRVMALAGLWDEWRDAEDYPIRSYTILTTQARGKIADIHERMPVILTQTSEAVWIDPDQSEGPAVLGQIKEREAGEIDCFPVSRRVNKPSENDAGLIEPAAVA
jgi:putative SOS response-associated peptidase YedK